jgi:hypothetical protein
MANSKAMGVAYEDPQFSSVTVTGAATVSGATTLNGNVAIGNAATDLVAFHGATAVDQAAYVASLSINALSVSGVIGFTTSASFSTAILAINSLIAAMVEKGLMAAS